MDEIRPAVSEPEPAPTAAPPGDSPRNAVAEWAVTILLLLFGTTSLVQAFVIPTGSMEDTLLIGDHLLVDKLAYAPGGALSRHLLPYEPVRRGDIIVFRYPVNIHDTFVKRVIGLPGDRIRLLHKRVYVDGRTVEEPYVYYKTESFDPYRDDFPAYPPNAVVLDRGREMLDNSVVNGEVVVPPGCYFAMGDNRDSSLDSRYWGFVPRENIVGKPLIVYWSYDATTQALSGSAFSPGHLRDLFEHFFTKTRWRRTFRLVHGYRDTDAGN